MSSNKDNNDVLYYNISIDNTSADTSGKSKGKFAESEVAKIVANNSNPIIADPTQYYASIVRFSVPCFRVPLINFIVQTPIITAEDVNKGLGTFTLNYNSISSINSHHIFEPQILDTPIPPYPSQFQTFSPYYYLYSYTLLMEIWNKSLNIAFDDLKTKVDGALDAANTPFFYYNTQTQLITLYAEAAYFDQSLEKPVYIYFNSVCQQFFNGFVFIEEQVGSESGLDDYFVVKNINTINQKTINSVLYDAMEQDYVSLAYLSPLKNIIITTNMNVNSEVFYVNSPSVIQNNNYINVLTDFIPDISGVNEAGIGSKIFIYNAPSLYRVFEFNSKTPLYTVSLGISWVDQLGNIYPLELVKGTIATVKIMFVKKTVFSKFLL